MDDKSGPLITSHCHMVSLRSLDFNKWISWDAGFDSAVWRLPNVFKDKNVTEFTSIFFMSKPHWWFHFWLSTLWAQLVLLYLLYCINLGSSQETLIPTHQLLELKVLLEVRIQQGMAKNVCIFNEYTCRRYMCAFACFVRMGVWGFNTFCWLHLGSTK